MDRLIQKLPTHGFDETVEDVTPENRVKKTRTCIF